MKGLIKTTVGGALLVIALTAIIMALGHIAEDYENKEAALKAPMAIVETI